MIRLRKDDESWVYDTFEISEIGSYTSTSETDSTDSAAPDL